MEKIFALFMMVAMVSLLGFFVENIWLTVTKGYMDNRNMMFPFLLGYGLAIVAIYLLFGTPEKICILGNVLQIESRSASYGLYFVLVMLCVSVGEIVLGTLVEKTCHFYWWDYSELPLHITRYTSIPTSAAFASIIVFFMGKLYTPVYNRFLEWNPKALMMLSVGLMVMMTADFLYSAYYMYTKKKMNQKWRLEMTGTWFYRKFVLKEKKERFL